MERKRQERGERAITLSNRGAPCGPGLLLWMAVACDDRGREGDAARWFSALAANAGWQDELNSIYIVRYFLFPRIDVSYSC